MTKGSPTRLVEVKKVALRGFVWLVDGTIRMELYGLGGKLQRLLMEQASRPALLLHPKVQCTACNHRYTPRKANSKSGCPACRIGRTR